MPFAESIISQASAPAITTHDDRNSDQRSSWRRVGHHRLLVAGLLVLLAGLLRFHKLGDWSFTGDETATIHEEAVLFLDAPAPRDSQMYRLPRIIPLGYFIHHVGNQLFGRDELGSRVAMAILGTVTVGLVFVLLDLLRGRPTAIATALLLALWPEHVFRSQETRFYAAAALFAFLALLLGALAAQRRSVSAAVLASILSIAALLCHTLLGVLIGILTLGVIAASLAERERIPKRLIAVFVTAGMIQVLFVLLYVLPLVRGWNQSETWGYSIMRSAMASVSMLGWPIALMAGFGVLLMLRQRSKQNWYWLTGVLGWGLATMLFPLIIIYHPGYIVPLTLSVLVAAGYAIGFVYHLIHARHGTLLAATWIAMACLANLPGLASHYVDGSRQDMRTAAHYVAQHWTPGDRVTGFSMALFEHYAPQCAPAIPLVATSPANVNQLKDLVHSGERLWVVVESGRAGLREDLRFWLDVHCRHEAHLRRQRFDYYDYCVDVFLYVPHENAAGRS